MAGPKIIILSEVNQDDKEKYHITYMWNLKYDTNELICKTERLTDIENKLMVTKGEAGGGIRQHGELVNGKSFHSLSNRVDFFVCLFKHISLSLCLSGLESHALLPPALDHSFTCGTSNSPLVIL